MKRQLLFVCALAASLWLSANPVSIGQARKRAESFMRRTSGLTMAKPDAATFHAREAADCKPYYVFNLTGGRGYVIASGDDRLPAVVGYSTEGSWPEKESDVPDALKAMLRGYGAYVEAVQNGKAEAPAPVRDESPKAVVGPLLTTKWAQSFPYNKYAPACCDTASVFCKDASYACRYPIGCAAVALGQIMNYWSDKGGPQHPQDRYTSVSWATDEGTHTEVMHLSPATAYDYAGIPRTIAHTPELSRMGQAEWEAGSEAVGVLLRDVAYALNMYWTPSGGGGANSLAGEGAAVSGMGMSYEARTFQSSFFDGKLENPEWWRLIQEDLDNGRPIYCGGSDKGNPMAGHAFVFDGYDTNHFVHVNWGWGGKCDNWFDHRFLQTSMYDTDADHGYDFASNNAMIHNLHPRAAGEVQVLSPEKFAIGSLAAGAPPCDAGFGIQGRSDNNYTIEPIVCQGATGLDFDYALVLADSAMRPIRIFEQRERQISALVKDTATLSPSRPLAGQATIFDGTMPDGIYCVYPLMRGRYQGQSTEWFRPIVAGHPDGAVRLRLNGNEVISFPEEYDKYWHEPTFTENKPGLFVSLHTFFNGNPKALQPDSIYNVTVLIDLSVGSDLVPTRPDADRRFLVSILSSDGETVSQKEQVVATSVVDDVMDYCMDSSYISSSFSADFSLPEGSYTFRVEDEILGLLYDTPMQVLPAAEGICSAPSAPQAPSVAYTLQGRRAGDGELPRLLIQGGKKLFVK